MSLEVRQAILEKREKVDDLTSVTVNETDWGGVIVVQTRRRELKRFLREVVLRSRTFRL